MLEGAQRGTPLLSLTISPADVSADMSQQAASHAKCEKLIASAAWLLANPDKYTTLVKRIELIGKSGLPAMRLVPNSTIEKLGRIPRSDEGH